MSRAERTAATGIAGARAVPWSAPAATARSSTLLGSVAQQCVHRAACPLVIVHHTETGQAATANQVATAAD